ncbi:MAG: YceI family protein [Polyangiales bacterium]
MPTHDAKSAQLDVLSFKEGLLSAVAHDLRLAAESFTITHDFEAKTVSMRVDANAIRVACARANGVDAPSVLSDRDRREIDKNLHRDVLDVARHPTITFASTSLRQEGDRWSIEGDLTLCGKTRSIRATVGRDGDAWTTEVRLHQPDFGIRPFSAMLGALKIKPDVLVRVRAPA